MLLAAEVMAEIQPTAAGGRGSRRSGKPAPAAVDHRKE